MVYSKTRQRVALTLVAMAFSTLGYWGSAYAADADAKPEEKEKSPIEVLFEKITKGFYGTVDVAADYATKGMGHMVAASGIGWVPSPNGVVGSGHYTPATGIKMANCPNLATGICNPYPVGNVGWMPELSTNKSGLGYRGSHKLPWKDTAFIYQIESNFSLTSAPGVTSSYTAQSNVTKSALGFGDTFVGFQNKQWGTIKFGTMYGPYKKSTDRMNPFSGMLGDYAVVMGNSGGDNRVEFGTRLEHSIMYESPKMMGGLFSFDFLVSPGQNRTYDAVVQSSGSPDCSGGNIPGSGNLPANCDDGGFTSAWSVDLKFEVPKRFYATAAYERHNNVNRNSDGIGSNQPIYDYYFGLASGTFPAQPPLSQNPLFLDMTPITVAGPSGGVVAPCGTGQCFTTIPLGAYTTDVGPETAAKVGAQYIFDFGLSVAGIYENLHRSIPSYLEFQNERNRNGYWLTATQEMGEAFEVSAGWAHAGSTTGDPGGQHQYNPFFPANKADMYTLAFKQKIDKQMFWYLDWAVTVNHGNAHYDLGAGGRGVTTDCHDGTHPPIIDYSSFGPTTWGGCHIQGVTLGVDYKF